MGLNIGYLTSDRTPQGDEVYTPFYAVAPILKYVDKNKNGFVYTKHFSEKEKKAIIEERKK